MKNEQSRTNKAIINVATAIASNIIIGLLTIVTSRVIKDKLGLDILGINGVFTNILTILSLSEMGIGSAISFALYKPLANGDTELIRALMNFYKKAYRVVALVVGILGLLILPFTVYFVATDNYSVTFVRVAFLLFLANSVFSYLLVYKRTIIIADQKNYIVSGFTLAYNLVLKTAQLLAVIICSNYLVYLAVAIVCTVVNNWLISLCADRMYPYIKDKTPCKMPEEERRQVITKVKALFLHSIGSVVIYGTDNILISFFSGVEDAGRYTSYATIITMVGTFLATVFENLKDSVGNYLVGTRKEEKERLFNTLFFAGQSFVLIATLCMAILLPPFMVIWLGKDISLNNTILFALLLSFVLAKGNMTIGIFKNSAGLFEQDRFVPLVESAINLGVSILLAMKIGILGVVMGTIISTALGPFWVQPCIVYKEVFGKKVWTYFATYLKYVIAFFTDLAVVYLVTCKWMNFGTTILGFILQAIVTGILAVGIWCLIFVRNENFLFYVRLVKEKLHV